MNEPNSIHASNLPVPLQLHWRYHGPETLGSLYFYIANSSLFDFKKLMPIKCYHLSTCKTNMRQHTDFTHITLYVTGNESQMHMYGRDICRMSSTLNASSNFFSAHAKWFLSIF